MFAFSMMINGTLTMTRFAIRDAIYRIARFGAYNAAICDLGAYNESDIANRESTAIHRKSPMLQYSARQITSQIASL